ncbi:hypothetical protein [Schumannella luteola]
MADLDPSGFSTAEGAYAGLTRGRMRSMSAPHHGIRAVATPLSLEERCRALRPALRPGERFSHTTAAALHRFRMPEAFVPRQLHVTSVSPTRAMERPGILGHSSRDSELVIVAGVPVSPPVRSWLECSELFDPDDLVVMGDGLLSRRSAIATVEQLWRAVDSWRTKRGYRALCRALPHLRPRTDSARETLLRLMVVRWGFPEPEVNGEIRNRYGALLGHGDLVFREQKVVLEYEGRQHLESKQFAIDIERLDLIMEEGWRVIRVDRVLFADPHRLRNKLAAALSRSS